MICPSCGNKPLSFAKLLVTINPFRINCESCGEALRAGPVAHTWMILHVVLGLGLVALYNKLMVDGVIYSSTGLFVFLAATLAIVFLTAYVIPWMFLKNLYRVDD